MSDEVTQWLVEYIIGDSLNDDAVKAAFKKHHEDFGTYSVEYQRGWMEGYKQGFYEGALAYLKANPAYADFPHSVS